MNTIPEYILNILRRLEAAGETAVLVGGCVRDLLDSAVPRDYDVATSALPERVASLFSHTVPTGIRHGTVTVLDFGEPVEVTTFRTEGEYRDHRRPETVTFVSALEADLARRDFTVNAMAFDLCGEIYDPFDGRKDLENRVLRAVGDPAERFREDALRMLRAVRFSARGFEIEEKTLAAMRKNAALTSHVATERIAAELIVALTSANPEKVTVMFSFGMLDHILQRKTVAIDCVILRKIPQNLRFFALAALLKAAGAIESAERFARALKLDGKMVSLARATGKPAPQTRAAWKFFIAKNGETAVLALAAAADAVADELAAKSEAGVTTVPQNLEISNLALVGEILAGGEPCTLGDLAIGGSDLLVFGFRGKAIGEILWALMEKVCETPRLNTREDLLLEIRKISENHD